MKPSEEIAEFIALRIGHVYFRPLMYGGTATEVDLLLYHLHEIWAEIVELPEKFRTTLQASLSDENCGASSFDCCYRKQHPRANEDDIVAYVIDQWRQISNRIGLPVLYSNIRNCFQHNDRLSQLFLDEES
jgi:hypothetical protein